MISYFFASTTGNAGSSISWIQIVVPSLIALLGVVASFAIYRNKVDRLEKDVEKYEKKIEALRTDADQLLEFKTQAQKFIDKNIYKDQSPLSLTEFGQKLVNDSGFKNIFKDVKDDLVAMLEAENPATQYEVQEKARALMDTLTTYAPFKPIEEYAYENGKDFNQILRAGGIMLRDYYFEKHPEIVNPNEQY